MSKADYGKYSAFVSDAVSKVTARGREYGEMDACFSRCATIASTILGKKVTEYELAVIMHSMKLARITETPANMDHYVDGANYFAFAGLFSQPEKEKPHTHPGVPVVNMQELEKEIAGTE